VGCGPRAKEHAAGYLKAEGVELVGVSDLDYGRAQAFAREFGTTPYSDAASLMDHAHPDIVSVATQPKGRAAVTELCAGAGARAVIAEKPMALNLEEADRMAAACERHGTILTVSHQMRYCPEFERGREAVLKGEIGETYFLRGVCYGNLMQQGTHVIDMLRWYMDDAKVSWVMAQADEYDWQQRDPNHPSPMWTVGYFMFENGVRATLEAGPTYAPAIGTEPGWLNKRVEALGTEGMADSVVGNYCRVLSKEGGWQALEIGNDGWNRATQAFIQDLARVVNEGGTHRNNAATSLHSFEVINALAESVRRGGKVELPLPRNGTDYLGRLLQERGDG
jgi:predicted dehydrogenase